VPSEPLIESSSEGSSSRTPRDRQTEGHRGGSDGEKKSQGEREAQR
jgi:hypothetical protein